jgi:hypothetical protein
MLTTAPIPVPDLASAGPWTFSALPPAAKIINFGQISVGNSSAYLIANQVENHGTILAPQGNIGLYAGKEVLVSERSDGRGLSAKVTLPDGSVDNQGRLIADAGAIAMHAKVVNQGGVVQANSVRNLNGVIELVASDSLNLSENSSISTKGDASGTSPGGFAVLRSGGAFSDAKGSGVNVQGAAGGANGVVEILAPNNDISALQSQVNGQSLTDYSSSGFLLFNPSDITLSLSPSDATPTRANFNLADLASYSRIDIHALNDITVNSAWVLRDPGAAAALTLNAGNNLILKDGSSIKTQDNWDLNLVAGSVPASRPKNINNVPRSKGLYLDGNSALQTANGSIHVWADNEVIVNPGPEYDNGTGNAGNNGIRTTKGGSIEVATRTGDVNAGGNFNGYTFGQNDAPYYKVSNNLGGISTAAGGDVTIVAGGDVTSFNPQQSDSGGVNKAAQDGGTGAFGPGNVTITAGKNISGHYVLADGIGTITAGNQIGVSVLEAQSKGFSLSLVKGTWSVRAPNGSIYVQDIRNPNGIFNDKTVSDYPGYHRFDYDSSSGVLLDAANSVEITGGGVPHTAPSANATPIPLIFPPTLKVIAGVGGFRLDKSIILFPSTEGDLNIATTGDLIGTPDQQGIYPALQMSDSGSVQWIGPESFDVKEHASTPLELDNPNPVKLTIGGSIKTVNIYATKPARIDVRGDVINSSFVGENFHASDVTSLKVAGNIYNTPAFVFQTLSSPIVSADPTNPRGWDSIFSLAVDPALAASIQVALNASVNDLRQDVSRMRVFDTNPGFVYNSRTLRLGFRNPMLDSVRKILEAPLTILSYGPDGLPLVRDGHYVTTTATFASPDVIESLYKDSLNIPRESPLGYQIGGPGEFRIEAGSMDLGTTLGVLSWGIGGPPGDNRRYAALAIDSGASIDIKLQGDLNMFTSTIASLYGGDVTVNSTGGGLDLGSQDLFGQSRFAFGIYTSGRSDVSVTAAKDINIEGSRIAAYNGGSVSVKSLDGNVNVGSGGNTYVNVQLVSRDQNNQAVTREDPIYGSGIVAVSLPADLRSHGDPSLPGDITVETPHGDILSSRAGILQIALDGNVAAGPKVTLVAGTPGSDTQPAVTGNIDLGDSGLIGGTVNVSAQGDIKGLIVSRQSSTVNAAQNFSGTVLAAGSATLSAGGSVSGSVIGIGGVTASAGGLNSANLLGQNVSVNGGASQSTLGPAAAATTTSQAAAQQSNTQAKEQVAANNTLDDDEKKKGAKKKPALTRRSRVTVILPNR